jgi:hypothetical protein
MQNKDVPNKKDRHKGKGKLVRFPGNMLEEVDTTAQKHGLDSTSLICSGTRMALNELKKDNPNLPPPL